jgi:predicted metal-dependent hydrolase
MKYSYGDQLIDIEIKRKMIKRLYFRFKNNKLIISSPYYISNKHILKVIDLNKITLDRLITRGVKAIPDDSKIWIMGRQYDIILIDGVKEPFIKNDKIYSESKEYIENHLNFLAKEYLQNKYNETVDKLKIGLNYKLKLRKMKSKWGVCNIKNKTITLNTKLFEKSVDEIEYVIIHELCHTVVFDHSKLFWNEVMKYCPDYKEIRKKLRRNNEENI